MMIKYHTAVKNGNYMVGEHSQRKINNSKCNVIFHNEIELQLHICMNKHQTKQVSPKGIRRKFLSELNESLVCVPIQNESKIVHISKPSDIVSFKKLLVKR